MLSGRHGEHGHPALKLARKKSEKREQGQELEAALRRLTKERLVLNWKKSHRAELKQRRATMFAALEMESTRTGMAGRLARANQIQIKSRSALQKEGSLEYNPGSEAASHPLAMASPVKRAARERFGTAMALTPTHVQFTEDGGNGASGLTALCHR